MRYLAVLLAALVFISPVSGHHSNTGLDMNSITTIEGTVSGYYFRNPHVYFTVETTDADGETVEWSMQMGSAIVSTRRGWSRDSLAPGDRVTVEVHPSLYGRPYGIVVSVGKEGGAISGAGFFQPQVTASTTTLEGIWMANASEQVSYPGGFDGFFIANLALTEKGREAREAYDSLSAENPESTCVGRPTPAMLLSSALYPIEIQFDENDETIAIRSEFWDETRTVYMDGREHPDNSERFASGHSIGRWDEDTLVVDTRNFTDHRSPYQIGVPSGAQKHVVERFRLIENGERIAVEFTLEDPEYISAPLNHARELIYSAHLELSPFDCDPEATRRFLIE